jgi:hypothetical protein
MRRGSLVARDNHGMAREVMVRTYHGTGQQDAVLLYAEDAPSQSVGGWVPIAQTWANGEWATSAYIAATILVIVGIGIVLLIVMGMYKPQRTLVVTYARDVP